MNEEILLADIDGLAAELATGYTHPPPTAQGRILRLCESLSRVRLDLLEKMAYGGKPFSASETDTRTPRVPQGKPASIPARTF